MKTKKQGKKIRARSKRRGEMSFRKIEGGAASTAMAAAPSSNSFEMGSHQDYNMGHFLHSASHHYQQNQQQECRKWAHFPVTICEALRTFGAEFNCFLPCRSSCMANQREKEEKAAGSDGDSNRSGCGAVFGRWLMVEGKEREIELVVGEEERRGSEEMRRSQRRHIFEDIEIKDEKMGEEEARVSICVPPKNALLLMRCRSDPVKMAALANRFWESPAPKDENGEKDDRNEEREKEEEKLPIVDEHEMAVVCRKSVSFEAEKTEIIPDSEPELETESETESPLDGGEAEEQEIEESNPLTEKLEEEGNIEYEKEEGIEMENQSESEAESTEESSPEISADPETTECEEINCISPDSEEQIPAEEPENEKEGYEEAVSNEEEFAQIEEQEAETEEEEETETREIPEPVTQKPGSNEKESQQKMLPDCLLLMMCEPKLSMEVSKETWVCSTDFIRWLPERPPPAATTKKNKGGGDEPKRRISIDSKPTPKLLQPPRASISFPVAPPMFVAAAAAQAPGGASMGTMIEQKLVGGKGYEPFGLKRCKSEPMRSAAKLAQAPVPDGGCFWKNRKLEPATLGVGAAGVGF